MEFNFNDIQLSRQQQNSGTEDYESKSMSILQDLDPHYAKIPPASPRKGGSKMTGWILAVLFLLGGAIWLIFNIQFGQKPGAIDQPATQQASLPAAANPPPVPAQAPTPQANEGSALIRENTSTPNEAKSGENTFETMQKELEKAEDKHTVVETNQPAKEHKSVKPSGQKKHATKPRSHKHPAPLPGTTASKTSHQGKTAKNPAERDLDIITAIVK